jgi:hypothetical protein
VQAVGVKMITEKQRLQMLAILSISLTDMDQIITEAKKQGYDLTPEQVRAYITLLKMHKGS